MATGDSYNCLATCFRMEVSAVHKIIKDTWDVIWDQLQKKEMPEPSEADWKEIAERFYACWNFPNCIGALYGKHIIIQSPSRSGSLLYNYKGTFCIVLMALTDCRLQVYINWYRILWKQYRWLHLQKLCLWTGLYNNPWQLNIPGPKSIAQFSRGGLLPHCIVADEAFPLRMDLMRPSPRVNRNYHLSKEQKIFNYRLSRARRIVENAFGIFVQRFWVFNRRLQLHPDNVDCVVKACCILHNYLSVKKDLPTLYNRLNYDNEPYLQPDGAILDVPNLNG